MTQIVCTKGRLPLSINLWAAKQQFYRPSDSRLQLLQAHEPFCGSLDATEFRMYFAWASYVLCSILHILRACCMSHTQA